MNLSDRLRLIEKRAQLNAAPMQSDLIEELNAHVATWKTEATSSAFASTRDNPRPFWRGRW